MASIYVVHSRVIPLCEHPFCYQDELRPIWKPFFQGAHGFAPFVPTAMDKLSKHPFLHTLGPLVLNPRRAGIIYGEKDTAYSWLIDRLSGQESHPFEDTYPKNEDQPFVIFGFDPQIDDQRQSLLYLECARRIPLRSAGRDDVCAQGNFYIHVYPAGYLVVHLVLTLKWQHPRSIPEVGALVRETCPWRSDGAWRWESRLANGKIHYLYLRLRTALFSAFFESHHTPLREGEWKTFVRHCFQEGAQELAEALWMVENFSSLKTDLPGLQSMMLSTNGAVIWFESNNYSSSRHLKNFWQVLQLAECVMLRKQIHADIFARILDALQRLQPFLSGKFPSVESQHRLEDAALDEDLLQYLQVLESYCQYLRPAQNALSKEFSHCLGLEDQYRTAMVELERWLQQMEDWDPAFMTAWKPVYESLQEIFPPRIKHFT